MIEPAPYREDFGALALAAHGLRDPAILSSSHRGGGELARYSVAAAEPILTLAANSPRSAMRLSRSGESRDGAESLLEFDSFSEAIAAALDPLAPIDPADLAILGDRESPFLGGLIGFLAFEFGARFERMSFRAAEPGAPPAMRLCCYPAAYVADHARREAWWICRESRLGRREGFRPILERIKHWIGSAAPETKDKPGAAIPAAGGWERSLDPSAHRAAVDTIKGLLRSGEAYQVNLTSRLRRAFDGAPARVFAELLSRNPAPYAAFLRGDGWAIASSSPELLIDLRESGAIQTRPIKGTIRAARGSLAGDAELREALARSPKDRAEHLMIVDLERNDLGRVCEFGSIGVDPMMAVESYRGLHHLVSGVHGRLRRGLGPADAIAALFPGGSVTGAPKVRALEIIHALEPVARGAYCGALGWISPEGACRMNLAIRTISMAAGNLDVHAGGGIVADSDADAEAAELALKAGPLLEAAEASMSWQAARESPK